MSHSYLSIEQVMAKFEVSKDTIYNWIKESKIPVHKFSKRLYRFKEADIEAWADKYLSAPVEKDRPKA